MTVVIIVVAVVVLYLIVRMFKVNARYRHGMRVFDLSRDEAKIWSRACAGTVGALTISGHRKNLESISEVHGRPLMSRIQILVALEMDTNKTDGITSTYEDLALKVSSGLTDDPMSTSYNNILFDTPSRPF